MSSAILLVHQLLIPFHTLLQLVWQTPPAARHTVYASISPPVPQHPTVICPTHTHTHTLSLADRPHTHVEAWFPLCSACGSEYQAEREGSGFPSAGQRGAWEHASTLLTHSGGGKPRRRSAGYLTDSHTLYRLLYNACFMCSLPFMA